MDSKYYKEFDRKFKDYKSKKIAIYGVGKNARLITENVFDYEFTCLVDKEHIGEIRYGLEICSIEGAIKNSEVILIAAIPSSAAIVYNRIKDLVPDEIPICDLQGYLLSGDDKYKKNPYWISTPKKLKELIDTHDVISFDIFDTLLTRITLFPRDIFDLMDCNKTFRDIRIKAEEDLYREFESPTLTQIYELISQTEHWKIGECDLIKKKELQTEQSCLTVRKKIYDFFKYAVDLNKTVYFTSDMYLEKDDLLGILSLLDITDGFKLLVSSEYDKTKESGELFDILIDKNPGKRILHIGDNQDTDIEMAKSRGIDTFYVKKGYDLLAESSCTYLFDLVNTDFDKYLLGFAISEMLNDPFALCTTQGKMYISSYECIAVCILPMTLLYLSKIVEWAGEYDEILFASRDGYYLYELYEWYRTNTSLNLPEGKYIYVSRSAISSMAVKSVNDIDVFLNKIIDDPKLNLKKLIENQFHITVSDDFDISTGRAVEIWGSDEIKTRIKPYYDRILENSATLRDRYLEYIRNSNIDTSGKIAVVDVVTQGTLVYGLSNIFENDIDLFALGTSAVPNKYINDDSRVRSVYGNVTERIGDSIFSMSDFSELHLFIEMLYASKEGQFYSVNDKLNPVFTCGSEYDPILLDGVQTCLQTMVDRFVVGGAIPVVSPDFALGMLRVFSKKFSVFSDDMKEHFSFEDPYDGSIQKCNLIDYIQ